jgi:ferredoxin-NADP reductase
LQVRAPAGHFYVDRGDAPVVLIGGGIGITPMLSMLNWCLAEQPGREVWLFYGVRHGGELVMKPQLDAMAAAHPNFHLQVCCSEPRPEDVAGRDYQHRGRIELKLLRLMLPLKPYHYYICGPTPMMASLVSALEDWGVPDARIHFEAFGPASIKRRTAAAEPSAGAAAAAIVVKLRQVRQGTERGGPTFRQSARIRRGQWHCRRFRLPGRRLRHLPDDHRRRRSESTARRRISIPSQALACSASVRRRPT